MAPANIASRVVISHGRARHHLKWFAIALFVAFAVTAVATISQDSQVDFHSISFRSPIAQPFAAQDFQPASAADPLPAVPSATLEQAANGAAESLNQAPVASPAETAQTVAAAPVVPQVAPAPIAWPQLHVNWQEVTPTPGVYLLNPIQGDGFYTGTMNTPSGFTSTPDGLAYLKAHFPQIEKAVMVAAARDANDKNIVFVSIVAFPTSGAPNGSSYLFLSVDGEKSWNQLNLAPVLASAVGSGAVRVIKDGDALRIIARDNTTEEKWWESTIVENDLSAH